MWVYYATYDEYGDVDKYVSRKIWYNGPDRELFHLRDHGSLQALWLFEDRKKKAKALEIQRKKEEEEALGLQRKKEEGEDLGSS